MKYFLWLKPTTGSGHLSDVEGPYDSSGRPFYICTKEFAIGHGFAVLEDVESGCMTLEDGGKIQDRIRSIELIVSDELKKLLSEVKGGDDVKFIPLSFRDTNGKVLPPFFFPFPLKSYRLKPGDGSRATPRETLLDLRPFFIERSQLPDLSFFYIYANQWLVSDEVRKAIVDLKFSGCEFSEIDVR